MTTPRAAIVIGSGFGGAAAATRLAEAGWQVTLLERGPWRDSVPVRSMGIERRSPFPQGRRLWRYLLRNVGGGLLPGRGLRLNPRGMFEIHFSRGLRIVCSAGVGGGSHAYAGLNVRPPDPAWWDDVDPALSSARMEAHYEHVLGRMGSRQPMADDRLPNTLEERFRDSAAIAAGGVDYELGMGFLFPETPGAPRKVVDEHGVERFEARPGEDGNLGSEGGGKTTLDFAFLAPAMRAGLTVRDQCEVKAISREGDGYSVAFVDHHDGATGTISAPRVIVAAGTLNTLRLLLHSEKAGGLAPMPRLGEGFGGNGDFFGYWKLDDAERDLTQSMPAHGPLRLREAEPLGPGRDWPMVVEGALPPPAALPLGGWVARMLRSGTFVAGMGPDA
ncbi:MAG: GMC family oxidoreductase N-terminal domain-containing protein, partial [Gammaproteobacteria bacterium]